ncbi:MAG: UMP kinase [Pseudomonadota bacterium]
MNSNRILIKLSGEFISIGSYKSQFDINALIKSIKVLLSQGYQICIVIGGGNICRGRDLYNQDLRKTWQIDKVGMLATMINANMLSALLSNHDVNNVILSSIAMPQFFETYTYHLSEEYLDKGRVVVFAGGTAMSGVSTDTLAVTRAVEMSINKVIKVTTIDGVYDSDPVSNKDARRIDSVSSVECFNCYFCLK